MESIIQPALSSFTGGHKLELLCHMKASSFGWWWCLFLETWYYLDIWRQIWKKWGKSSNNGPKILAFPLIKYWLSTLEEICFLEWMPIHVGTFDSAVSHAQSLIADVWGSVIADVWVFDLYATYVTSLPCYIKVEINLRKNASYNMIQSINSFSNAFMVVGYS